MNDEQIRGMISQEIMLYALALEKLNGAYIEPVMEAYIRWVNGRGEWDFSDLVNQAQMIGYRLT